MHWIYLTALIVIAGAVFGVRCLVLPALRVVTPEQATLFMGKLMPRVRNTLRFGVLLLVASELYAHIWKLEPVSARTLTWHVLTVALSVVLLLMCVSPHRRLALKVERYRTKLLDLALLLVVALTATAYL